MNKAQMFTYCVMDPSTEKCIAQYEIPYPDYEVHTREKFIEWCEAHLTEEFKKNAN